MEVGTLPVLVQVIMLTTCMDDHMDVRAYEQRVFTIPPSLLCNGDVIRTKQMKLKSTPLTLCGILCFQTKVSLELLEGPAPQGL